MNLRIRNEEGSALLLALAFLALFGLWIAAVLGFGNASVLATERLRDQRIAIYAADGAVQGAIQFIRGATDQCGWSYSPPCHFNVTIGGLPVTVDSVFDGNEIGPVIDADRTVKFTASIGGVEHVVARVLFQDSTALNPTAPDVYVLSWAVFG